jgi:hypothetical protein
MDTCCFGQALRSCKLCVMALTIVKAQGIAVKALLLCQRQGRDGVEATGE